MGILERGGKVRHLVVPNRRKRLCKAEVKEPRHCRFDLFTDALPSYDGLDRKITRTKSLTMPLNYVDGQVHTNGMENYWSLLKRGIKEPM